MTHPPTVGPSDEALVERLTELLAEAAPGPWKADDGDCDIWGAFEDQTGAEIVYAIDPSRYHKHDDDGRLERAKENIALIVEAVNALPALLARITALQREGEAPWIVWSNEHHAFWRANHSGYTRSVEQAGRYSHTEAEAICRAARPRANSTIYEGEPPEICMPAPEALDAPPPSREQIRAEAFREAANAADALSYGDANEEYRQGAHDAAAAIRKLEPHPEGETL